MSPEQVIKKPIVLTEKAASLKEENKVIFAVDLKANKIQIRQAVESIFDVRVLKVTTANRQGKRKRNRRTFTYGKRPDTKRAIVTLVEGDTIDLFQD
jgi:large subunit ribosomal protein L23